MSERALPFGNLEYPITISVPDRSDPSSLLRIIEGRVEPE